MECPTSTYGPCSPAAASRACRSAAAVIAVLGTRDVVAPALAGAVVGADPGGRADRLGDPGPGGGELAQAVEEHDRGSARRRGSRGAAGGRPRRRSSRGPGRRSRCVGRTTFWTVAPTDAAARKTRTGVSSQRPRPVSARRIWTNIHAAEGQHRRRPHPGERGECGILRGEDHEAGAGGRHRDRRDERSTAAAGWSSGPTGRASSPSRAPKARSIGPGDDALGGAGEDDQGEDQSGHHSGGQRAGDDTRLPERTRRTSGASMCW